MSLEIHTPCEPENPYQGFFQVGYGIRKPLSEKISSWNHVLLQHLPDFSETEKLWHFHPIAFVQHLKRLFDQEILVFPGTSFIYRRTKMSLNDCLKTLPSQFRSDFKSKVENVIKEIYELGFAVGVWKDVNAGYRTFQQQYDIDPSKTNSGPGESAHNYGYAIDLGFLEWTDKNNKVHKNDFWLGGMDQMKAEYSGFSNKVWLKRNELAENHGLNKLSWETIHLQGKPANWSGRYTLVSLLNTTAAKTGNSGWSYQRASTNKYSPDYDKYKSKLDGENWLVIGTAKQMWNNEATNCTDEQRKKIKKDIEAAESDALTF